MAKKAKQGKTAQTDVDSIRHKDKRANIPTEELRDFVADGEKSPKTMLYPRDSSLDPQLVWKGKDEQDAQDLAVSVVPVYIQEKIHPQALIEDLRAQTAKDAPDPQANLYADFNGIEFEQYIDFYHHAQNWTNRMILGDSLLVMASLACISHRQNPHAGGGVRLAISERRADPDDVESGEPEPRMPFQGAEGSVL